MPQARFYGFAADRRHYKLIAAKRQSTTLGAKGPVKPKNLPAVRPVNPKNLFPSCGTF